MQQQVLACNLICNYTIGEGVILMINNRGLKNRKTISNAVRTELAETLKQLSEVTKIPMSKLLDEALEDLINEYANSTKK